MKAYWSLVHLQFLKRIAALRPSSIKADFANKKGRMIGQVIAFAVLFLVLAVYLVVIENYLLDGFMAIGSPQLLLSLVVVLSMMMTLVLGFFYVISSLYFNKDATFLASLPATSTQAFAAKMTQIWASEVGITAILLLPSCIIYTVKVGADAMLFVRALVVLLFAPVLPLAIVALLSTVLIRISGLWKHRDALAVVGGIIFMIAIFAFQMTMNTSMPQFMESPEAMTQILDTNQAMLRNLTAAFPPALWAANGLNGDVLHLLLFAAVCAGVTAVVIPLLGRGYLQLALLQSEANAQTGRAVDLKTQKYEGKSPLNALYQRELSEILRTPTYAMNCLPTVIMPIIVMAGMGLGFSRGMEMPVGDLVASLRDQLGSSLTVAILTAMMSLFMGMNMAVSTAVSREGKRHGLYRMMPLSPRVIIGAKLKMGMVISAASCVLGVAVILVLAPALWLECLITLALTLLIAYIDCALGLYIDETRPKLNWSSEVEAIKQNFNGVLGMLVGMLAVAVLALPGYLMISNGATFASFCGALLALCVLMALGSRALLYRGADRAYATLEG